jgi:hypothetical protein
MADPRRPTESVVKVERTRKGGERITIRTETGRTETVVTSPSSVAAIDRAAKTYRRALKELADE